MDRTKDGIFVMKTDKRKTIVDLVPKFESAEAEETHFLQSWSIFLFFVKKFKILENRNSVDSRKFIS